MKAAIFNKSTLKSAAINVETFKDELQLSNSQSAINTALKIARSVTGVTSIKTDMRLK